MTIENRLRKLEEIVAARPVERVGPPVWEQVQAMLRDPQEVAAAVAWDNSHLAAIDFAGLDEEAHGDALEQALAASAA
jgi:hypothetical protein